MSRLLTQQTSSVQTRKGVQGVAPMAWAHGAHGGPWDPWGPWGHGAHGAHGPLWPGALGPPILVPGGGPFLNRFLRPILCLLNYQLICT